MNPYFMDEYNRQQEQALMLAQKGGAIKPIEYFGRYNFSSPTAAAQFIQTPQFTGFWDRANAGINNIGVRAELNDSGRYNSPSLRWSYEKEMQYNKDVLNRRLANPNIDPKVAQKAYENASVASRAAGRFYTQQGLPNSVNDTSFYLNSKNSQLDGGSYPVRVIADERLSRFSLSNRTPFNGNIPQYPEQITVDEALRQNRNTNLTRTVGTDLGASLSSNPKGEAFVSSQMASQESRHAGRVNVDTGEVTLIGKPKTPIRMQMAGNAINATGTFMNYAGIIPLVADEAERRRSDYQNPVTQEYFTKDRVTELDGITYDSATPQQIAMFHPDNAEDHPEITDEMRKKFYPKWFEK
jgi:hypothetical protein